MFIFVFGFVILFLGFVCFDFDYGFYLPFGGLL